MRVTLPSKQADGTAQNWVDVADVDDLMGEDFLIIRKAVKIKSSPQGETEYSPKEMEDDRANAFLGRAITAWSFPAPIPAENKMAAADVAITRVLRWPDYLELRRAVEPIVKEIDTLERQDPKSSSTS